MLLLLLACSASDSAPETGDSAEPTPEPCPDGTLATPFDPAGDLTLPGDQGDWTLGDTWTGCDSYIFAGISADDGYTSLLLDSSFKKLLTKGPTDAHYVLFPDAAGNGVDTMVATLRATVDDALASLDSDEQAWWSPRLHVLTSPPRQLPGWLGEQLAEWQYPLVGLDRAQTIREIGYLADPLTGWTTADWETLGYEVQLYDFEALRQARLDAEDATIIRVFDHADTRESDWTGAAVVDLPDAATMETFNHLEVDVTIECGGPWYESCPEWDTSDYVQLCQDDDPGTDEDESQTCEELARIITGYWRGGRWVMDAPHQLPNLRDGGTHTFRYAGSMANIVTVDLRLWHEDGAPTPVGATQLWWETGDFWDATYDERHADHEFEIPADATGLQVVGILTGHGNDGSGCGEFCPSEQTVSLNGGSTQSVSFPTAGTQDGCADRVATDGSLPNQAGTWTYGRNGWCPGLGVAPTVWDLGADANFGGTNTLHYQALLDGEPYVTDSDGNLDVGMWVVWTR